MINKSDSISDSIYGRVEINEIEKKIIDSAAFQRLRNIRQLGLCEFVFPGAVHSRFSHSIGVMHVAGKYFDAIYQKIPQDSKLSADLNLLRRIFRLTALLHDVGHGPFSHLFEHMLVYHDEKENRLIRCTADYLGGTMFGIPKGWIKPEKEKSYFDKPLEHEHYSLAVIREIFSGQAQDESIPNDIAQSICCLMDEDIELSKTVERILTNLRTGFLSSRSISDDKKTPLAKKKEIESLRKCIKSMISGEFDADRIDYLARDAQHCGVRLAAGDVDYLLGTLSLQYEPERPKSELEFSKDQNPPQNFYLLMAKTGVRPFEQLLMARKQMFDIVYSHRINDSFGRLLEIVVEDILKQNHSKPATQVGSVAPLRGAPKTAAEFLRMTDDWLWRQVEAVANNSDRYFSEQAETAARMIVTRTPLVRIPTSEAEVFLEELEDRENQIKEEHKNNCLIIPRKLKELTKLSRDNARYDSEILRIQVRGQASRSINVSAASELLNSTLFTKAKVRLFAFETLTKSAELQALPQRFKQWQGLSEAPFTAEETHAASSTPITEPR
jgi:HD superfamily phosphohydrolase